MNNELKDYTDMNNEQKAQAIYNQLLDGNPDALEEMLISLSDNYDEEPVRTLNDWLELYRKDGDLFELIRVAQESEGLNIENEYIRDSIYYYGAKTSDNVIDLVDEDEAVDWIASALDDRSDLIDDIDKVMQIKFN